MRLPAVQKLKANFQNYRLLDRLVPSFAAQVEQLLKNCRARGVEMVPYETLVGPAREAKMWQHSRTWAQAERAAQQMSDLGAPRLARMFRKEWARAAGWRSNALPGRSWHSRGLAVDCFWSVAGRVSWDNRSAGNGYVIYAEEARKLGLTAGHYWQTRDSVHVQQPSAGGPTEPWSEVERLMGERFEI